MPRGIEDTYTRILCQLREKHPGRVDDMRAILRWLVRGITPLTLQKIAEATSLAPGEDCFDEDGVATDPTDLAKLLGSLIEVHISGKPEDSAAKSGEETI
jgi:hypothetical protein